MAFLLDLRQTCDEPSCKSRATVALINRYNSTCGRFCRKHGERALARFLEKEREANRVRAGLEKKE
jgi:hypothetical protein